MPGTKVCVRLWLAAPRRGAEAQHPRPGFWGTPPRPVAGRAGKAGCGPGREVPRRCSIYQHCCGSPWRPGLAQLQAVPRCYTSDIMPGVAKEGLRGGCGEGILSPE